MTQDPTRLMRIGELAQRSGLSLRTLRHYDDIGLLTPSARSDGGFRLYTEDDLARLMIIRRMKPLGYSLEDMQHVMTLLLSAGDAPPTRERRRGAAGDRDARRWNDVVEEARRRREGLARQVEMADEFIDLLTERSAGYGIRAGSTATRPRDGRTR